MFHRKKRGSAKSNRPSNRDRRAAVAPSGPLSRKNKSGPAHIASSPSGFGVNKDFHLCWKAHSDRRTHGVDRRFHGVSEFIHCAVQGFRLRAAKGCRANEQQNRRNDLFRAGFLPFVRFYRFSISYSICGQGQSRLCHSRNSTLPMSLAQPTAFLPRSHKT